MNDFIEICGTPIEIKSIKDFRIVKKEYIYRPVFREIPRKNFLSSVKYEFETMEPYAAIVGEGKANPLAFWKALDSSNRRYECVNAAGRSLTLSLDDVPILVHLPDGHTAEVHKGDPNFNVMGRDKTPYIEMVEALVIQAKEQYVFYGNNIHLYSVLENYSRIKEAVTRAGGKKNNPEPVVQEALQPIQPTATPTPKKDILGGLANNISGAFGSIKGAVGGMFGGGNQSQQDPTPVQHTVTFPDFTKPQQNTGIFPNQEQPFPDATSIPVPEQQPFPEFTSSPAAVSSNTAPPESFVQRSDETRESLKALKQRYESGEISRDEFNLAMNKFLDEL